jgi:rod shape determining protein RodA
MYRTRQRNFLATWQDLLYPWRQIDWWLLGAIVGVNFFAGLVIQSTNLNRVVVNWQQHWIFGGVGLVIALVLARIPPQKLLKFHWYSYAFTCAILIAVDVLGQSAKGAQRWISIGDFKFQPSEFAKVGVILTLAAVLHHTKADKLFSFVRALLITAIPWGLVFAQPDLGTSLVFGAISLGMLYWANARYEWIFLLATPVVSAILYSLSMPAWGAWVVLMMLFAWRSLPLRWVSAILSVGFNWGFGELGHVFWNILKDYQKDRLIVFLDPEKYPLGAGYHLIQSKIAISAGELFGQGFHQGTQTQLNFIPEQHTDFVFSAIGEEFGFVGSMALLFTYLFICWRMLKVAREAQTNFGSLLAIGALSMISFQTIINISMTIGIAPVTGIPLPWITWGRSSLLANFIAVGLVLSVANHRRKYKLS